MFTGLLLIFRVINWGFLPVGLACCAYWLAFFYLHGFWELLAGGHTCCAYWVVFYFQDVCGLLAGGLTFCAYWATFYFQNVWGLLADGLTFCAYWVTFYFQGVWDSLLAVLHAVLTGLLFIFMEFGGFWLVFLHAVLTGLLFYLHGVWELFLCGHTCCAYWVACNFPGARGVSCRRSYMLCLLGCFLFSGYLWASGWRSYMFAYLADFYFQGVWGFLAGGLTWFAIPFGLATVMSLGNRSISYTIRVDNCF